MCRQAVDAFIGPTGGTCGRLYVCTGVSRRPFRAAPLPPSLNGGAVRDVATDIPREVP